MFGLAAEEIPDFEDLVLEPRKIITGDFLSFLPEWAVALSFRMRLESHILIQCR
jgi:hypothetical protein